MSESLFSGMEPASTAASGWFTAHCDGGSRGNPGPAGYGAIVEDPRGRVVARLSEFLGRQTNNFAEYKGLLAVLAWARQNGVRQLRVISDSELMVKQVQGQYKVASPALRPLWEEARRVSREFERFEISHTLRGGNKEADRLANEAMDKGMGRSVARPSIAVEQPVKIDSQQEFEGVIRNGVVELINGKLPEGTRVQVRVRK